MSAQNRRNSNLELYRIIVMLLIVAHHYVVHSGLSKYIEFVPQSLKSSSLLMLGAWGKTGIDCFILITGYFMCKSKISVLKFVKLYIQICFYALIIYSIFCLTDKTDFSIPGLVRALFPFWSIRNNNFAGCFLLFYLFIPFINILINSLDRIKHRNLLLLLLITYTIIPCIPGVKIDFNYISWFSVLYILSAYIRLYGLFPKITPKVWGWISLQLIAISGLSFVALEGLYKHGITHTYGPYYLVYESNRIMPLLIAVSSFMFFKDLKIPYIPSINIIGGCTFGVLLIHDNSDAMRHWLWYDVFDNLGNFTNDALTTILYAVGSIVITFIVCAGIELLRSRLIENLYLKPIKSILQKYHKG